MYVKAVNRNDSGDLPTRVLVKKEKDTISTYNNIIYYYKAIMYLFVFYDMERKGGCFKWLRKNIHKKRL